MEPEFSILFSQETTTGYYPKPDESGSNPHILFLSTPGFPKLSLSFRFFDK
jgi:hypothetical protein